MNLIKPKVNCCKGLDRSGRLQPFSQNKRATFETSSLLFLHTKSLLKSDPLPKEANSFLLQSIPLQKGA